MPLPHALHHMHGLLLPTPCVLPVMLRGGCISALLWWLVLLVCRWRSHALVLGQGGMQAGLLPRQGSLGQGGSPPQLHGWHSG